MTVWSEVGESLERDRGKDDSLERDRESSRRPEA